MDPLAKVFAFVFMITTMLSIGLKVATADLLAVLRERTLMAMSLAANFVLLPLLGLVLVHVLPMSPDVAVGLLLLASAPGGLNAVQFTSKTAGGLSYAATLVFILTFVSVIVSPVIAALMLPSGASLRLPYGRIIESCFCAYSRHCWQGWAFGRRGIGLRKSQRSRRPCAVLWPSSSP